MSLPTPTVLAATVAYTKFTTTRYLIVPTIANLATPSLAEISAGKDVTQQLTAISGFDTSTAELPLNLGGSSFTGSLPGRKTANASSMTFELSQAGPASDIRGTITEGLVTNVVICNEGLNVAAAMDIFPVRVGSVAVPQDLEAIAMAMVQFYIYKPPVVGVTVPSA